MNYGAAPGVPADSLNPRQRCELVRQVMETERSQFFTLWRDLNDYIMPTRGRFWVTDNQKADRRSKFILDSSPVLAARTLASGMMSGVTSPSRPWFRLTTPDPELAESGPVKSWLFTVTERMRWVLSRTNFYHRLTTLYLDLGVFGTAALFQVEDDEHITRFVDLAIGSYAIGNDERDMPTVMTRYFNMKVRQLVKKFGIDNVSQTVVDLWRRGNLNTDIPVVHVILPNEEFKGDSIYAKDFMPWKSLYYEQGAPMKSPRPMFLKESGFEMFPVSVPVWQTTAEDSYGTDCPGITALSDIKQLYITEKRGSQALEKSVNPPMTGPEALRRAKASILPGEVTYIDVPNGQQGFRPAHETHVALGDVEAKQAQVRQRIDRAFYADLFLMLTQMGAQKGKMTATEIAERHEEKLLALGPVLEQLDLRLLDPVVMRTFHIMQKRGFIPPAPPDIRGSELKVEYISVLHQAQKATQLGGLRSVAEFIEPIAARDPSVFDKVDMDKVIEHFAEDAGVPPDIIRSDEKVAQIRQARAQAAKEERQVRLQEHASKTAKNLAQANTGGQNALTDLAAHQAGQSQPDELSMVPSGVT